MQFEPGKYRASIRDYGVYQSPAGQQHPTVFVSFEVIGRYDPPTGELESCANETRTYFKAITEKTIDWVLSDLRAIGYDKVGFKYLDPEVPGAADLFGLEIDVDCEHEIYEGSMRERWSIRSEPARKKLTTDELARLDAQYAAKFEKAFGAPPPAAPLVAANTSDETF